MATIAFGVFPLFLLLAITAFGGPEGYFSLAIIALGAFGFIVPKKYYRLGEMDKRGSRLLNLRRLRSSRKGTTKNLSQIVVKCRNAHVL